MRAHPSNAVRSLLAAAALAFAASACAAGAAGTAACDAACPAPELARPEPALHRAVHVAWNDRNAARALRYQIERRNGPAQEWIRVAQIEGDQPPHFDDASPDGGGLALGEYAYRVRGLYRVGSRERWSEWSPAQSAIVREACAAAGGALAGLPRVVARDLDGDGRHTGEDLERALRECSRLGGCVLEALPVTYDDVSIVLSDGDPVACDRERTACLVKERFPKGIAIEGHGSATVLRSPLWSSPYQPKPVLDVWRRPDIRLQLRHLVLDGRKTEQRDPLPGKNNADTWHHFGLRVWNRWSNHDERNRNGCVHDVVVRNFMTRGITLADVARWSVEHSAFEDIGCVRSLTPCSRLTVPDAFGPGYTSTGLGIHIDWHSDDVSIQSNRLRRIAKYSISLKHWQDGAEASIRRPRVVQNDIDEAGTLGMFVGGVADGLFEDNRIASAASLNPQPEASTFNDTFGISCNGAAERTTFRRNRIERSGGLAIMWNCFGRGNTIAETRISGSCRQKGPRRCQTGSPKRCYVQPDIWIPDGAAGSLALVDNEVVDSGCAAPLAVDLNEPDFEVVVRGGRYAAGRDATDPVRFRAGGVLLDGVSFTGTTLSFGPLARGVVAPSVSVSGVDEPYRIDRKADVLVCPESRRKCEKICSEANPPGWCAKRVAPAMPR